MYKVFQISNPTLSGQKLEDELNKLQGEGWKIEHITVAEGTFIIVCTK